MQSSIPVADGRIGYLLMAMMPQLTRRVPTTMYGRPFTVVGLRKGDRFETLKKIKVKAAGAPFRTKLRTLVSLKRRHDFYLLTNACCFARF
jgi:hypothetical protein